MVSLLLILSICLAALAAFVTYVSLACGVTSWQKACPFKPPLSDCSASAASGGGDCDHDSSKCANYCASFCEDSSDCDGSNCDGSRSDGSGCDSAAIAAANAYNCFAPAEHVLGSFALQNALLRDLSNSSDSQMMDGLNEIETDRGGYLLYAVGSAAVAPCGNGGYCDDNVGKCYQIRIDPGVENTHTGNNIDVIMQSVNTGLTNAFDIFQAQGGAGAFGGDVTACDILWGSKEPGFWENHIQDSSLCGHSENCAAYFDFVNPPQEYMKESLIESCRVAVESGVACPTFDGSKTSMSGKWREIKCPFHLTEVTGLRRSDEPSTYPTASDDDASWLGTDTWGTTDDVTNFAPNETNGEWIDSSTGTFVDSLQITQMMDCRSPEASQNFRGYASYNNFTDTYYDSFESTTRAAAFNINLNGDLITVHGYHGCNIYSPDASQWVYPLGEDGISNDFNDYTFGNCPSAFPPDTSYCVRYTNTQECGRRKVEGGVTAGQWDPLDASNWSKAWSDDDQCSGDVDNQQGQQVVYKGSAYTTASIGGFDGYTDPNNANACYWKNCPGYLGGNSVLAASGDGVYVFPDQVQECTIPMRDRLYTAS